VNSSACVALRAATTVRRCGENRQTGSVAAASPVRRSAWQGQPPQSSSCLSDRLAALGGSEFPQTGVVVRSQYVKESYAVQRLEESAARVDCLLKDRVMEPRGFAAARR
jgi:hypothetical protein